MNKNKADYSLIEQLVERGQFEEQDDPYSFLNMPESLKINLLTWCLRYSKKESINRSYTSYGLKSLFENHTGNYVTNGQFKGAMLTCGFKAEDYEALNYRFNVSGKEVKRDFEMIQDDRPLKARKMQTFREMNDPKNRKLVLEIEAEISKAHAQYQLGFEAGKQQTMELLRGE